MYGEDIFLDMEEEAQNEARRILEEEGLTGCFTKVLKCEELSCYDGMNTGCYDGSELHQCRALVQVTLPPSGMITKAKIEPDVGEPMTALDRVAKLFTQHFANQTPADPSEPEAPVGVCKPDVNMSDAAANDGANDLSSDEDNESEESGDEIDKSEAVTKPNKDGVVQ